MTNNNLNTALLGFLMKGSKHGYDLYKDISDSDGFGQVYRLKIGNVYAILKKLESQKLIDASTVKEGNRPPKNLYKITKKGRKVFLSWLNAPLKHGRDLRVFLLLKIYFTKYVKDFDQKEIISNQKVECKKWLQIYKDSESEKESFKWIVDQYRIAQINGYIEWLNWCERSL